MRRRVPGLDIVHLAHWHRGAWLEAPDQDLLETCAKERRVFVTYDQATIPSLLRRWAEEERDHAGIFFADEHSVPPESVGRVASALAALVSEIGQADTTNLVRYLRPTR